MRLASYLIFILYLQTTYERNLDRENPYSGADSELIKDNPNEIRDDSSPPEKCYILISKCFLAKTFDVPIQFGKEFFKSFFLPQSPEEIDVKLKLYTTKNRYDSFDYDIESKNSRFTNEFFDPEKKTVFIIHGFRSSHNKSGWMSELKDLILQSNDYNVIAVDWEKGASKMIYWQAVRNIETVSCVVFAIMDHLRELSGMQFQDVHIIGHSLGAHVASYTASLILENSKIHQITALDPAGPGFESMPFKLDPSLANYVEIIHTDYAEIEYVGFGLKDLTGHVDFFPNGGFQQPGCEKQTALYRLFKKGFVDGIISCNHGFATKLMLFKPDQLTDDCQMVGYACKSHLYFTRGLCTDCGKNGNKCAIFSGFGQTQQMQVDAQTERPPQAYYFQTKQDPPYCFHHYGISFIAENVFGLSEFSFTLVINGSKNYSMVTATLKDFPLQQSNIPYYQLHLRDTNIGVLESATLHYTMKYRDYVHKILFNIDIDRLIVTYMSNLNERVRQEFSATMCSDSTIWYNNWYKTFIPCPDDRENEPSLRSLSNIPPKAIQVNHAGTGSLQDRQQNSASHRYVATRYHQQKPISGAHLTGHPRYAQYRSQQVNRAGTG